MSSSHDKKTAAANGRPAKCHYRGVHKRPGGRYGVQIANPGKETSFWLGTFDTAEQAALVYDSAARQLQGDKAVTNFPNPNHLLCPEAALPPKALEVRLSRRYSSGDAATGPMLMYNPATEALELSSYSSARHAAAGPMCMYDPPAPLPPEALELSSYSSARHAAAGPMCMYDPPAPLPPEALELSSYSSGRHTAAGPMFMYHPEAPFQPEALELSLSRDAATGPMFMYHPTAPLPPEALELKLSSYSSGGGTAAEPMFMYHPASTLPQEALELSLSSYSSSGHVANGPMFMYHQGMINNDIHNNVDMSYDTSVGGSSNSGYSGCWKSKNLELGLEFPPQ